MSAPTAELLQITISPEEVFGQMPKDSLAALMHPDRNELRISMLNLEQEIAQYVAYKLKSTTHTSPTTFAHPDYTDLSLSAYATDFTDGRFQITKTNINRGNDTRLLQAAAPIVHYAIQAQQPAGESISMGMLVFEGGDCQMTIEERTVATRESIDYDWGVTPDFHYNQREAILDTRNLTTKEDLYIALDENTDFGALLLKMYDSME
jgi:hypothetical protein